MASLQGSSPGSVGTFFLNVEEAWDAWLFGDVAHTNANLDNLSTELAAAVATRRFGEGYGDRRDAAGKMPAVYLAITGWEPEDDTSNAIRWKLTITVHVWAIQNEAVPAFRTVRDIAAMICSMVNQMHRAEGVGDLDVYIGEAEEPEFSPVMVRVDPQEDNAIVYESTFTFSWWYREVLNA